jgi:surface antigen
MFKKTALVAGAAMLTLVAASGSAWADDCRDNRAAGTVLGAIAGGLIGGAAGHGHGGAIVGGALLGGIAGNAISRDIDCDDRGYAQQAYEQALDGDIGERYEWTGRGHGYVIATREYRMDGHRCRDVTAVVWHHGDRLTRDGTACHRHGEWEFVS